MQPERNGKDKFINFIAFFALAIIAILIVIENFFPIIGIKIEGTFVSILRTLQSILILLTIGIAGYNYVKDKKKGWKIAYWIIIAVFVASIVLIWIKNSK